MSFGWACRYCTVQPRFPLGNAAPTLWMICYRSPTDLPVVSRIPLGNARVMIEGPQDSSNGIIVRSSVLLALASARSILNVSHIL